VVAACQAGRSQFVQQSVALLRIAIQIRQAFDADGFACNQQLQQGRLALVRIASQVRAFVNKALCEHLRHRTRLVLHMPSRVCANKNRIRDCLQNEQRGRYLRALPVRLCIRGHMEPCDSKVICCCVGEGRHGLVEFTHFLQEFDRQLPTSLVLHSLSAGRRQLVKCRCVGLGRRR